MEQRVRLTALIITLNGERLLGKCLESLSFCDRILIVDSFSSDKTEEIAKEHGAIFIQNKWPGNAKQIRYGIDWLAANAPTDWVLMLDCDEIISPELKADILSALASPGDKTAFSMPRRTWYFDRFLKHGGSYPDRLFRLFLPEAIRIDNNGAHQKFVPSGPYGELSGDMLHYTYSSFQNQLEKLNDYAERGARDLEAKGKKGGVLTGLLHGAWRFLDMYVRKLGLLDGRAGFLMAAHTSFYTFLKYVRIREGGWGAPYDHGLGGADTSTHPDSRRV
ncbi:glycosyltransferase family 2 protein [Mailhella massiliensis]|uniref:Glycosyltransferase family 2 protein n=1 Tax=Mailhella massiliensis TaxID=1903261 RepID=A0A921AXY2_9BACT|nr:glycosyltransferase family 2 protein [Mailhella massiliensis]HJD98183.1 glycosyltransferase family 2 protein [Mailhella massiliensis]